MTPLPATTHGADTPPAPRPQVSVVIPVHNRLDQVRQLLAALAQQTLSRDRFEVLICDDGSSADLSPVLAEAVDTHGFTLTHLWQPQSGPGPARNLGLAHARGELVAFTDSDCEPEPQWLAELEAAFADPAVGLAGGHIEYRRAEYLSGQCVNYLMSSMLGSGGARDPRALVHMDYYPRTCNMAVRRALAIAAGGFPAATHGEDLEFSQRVRKLAVEVRFVPGAAVVHNEKRTLPQIFREAFLKGATRVHLARRIRLHQLIHSLPAGLVLYTIVLVLALAVQSSVLPFLAIPGLLYLAVLGVLAVQGAAALGVRAAGYMPLCALLMHWGYGLGYLSAAVGAGPGRAPDGAVNWNALVSRLPSPLRPIPAKSAALPAGLPHK